MIKNINTNLRNTTLALALMAGAFFTSCSRHTALTHQNEEVKSQLVLANPAAVKSVETNEARIMTNESVAPAAYALSGEARADRQTAARPRTVKSKVASNRAIRAVKTAVAHNPLTKIKANTAITVKEKSSQSNLEPRVRTGIILIAIGLIVEILAVSIGGSVAGVIYLIGAILIVIGLVVLLLYLLDAL